MKRILSNLAAVACVLLITSIALAAAQSNSAPQPWWSGWKAGMVGGIAGSVIGVFGGILGTLCGLGKGRRFVLAWTKVLIVLGAMSLVAGLVAVMLSQPYAVPVFGLAGGVSASDAAPDAGRCAGRAF